MIKKVLLTNTNTGRAQTIYVDADTDEKAIKGAARTPAESAKITNLTGLDEKVYRATSKGAYMEDRMNLFSGIARCLQRNISTIKSFELQASRMRSARYRGAVAEIAHQISLGEKVSDAMSFFPDLFGPEVLAMIEAGEEAGRLPEICTRLGAGQRKTLRIIRKLKSGMIYPAIVIFIAIGVTITMSFTLVPAVSKLYGQFEAQLPLPTRIMMKFSQTLIAYPYLAILPFLAVYMLMKNWGKLYAKPEVQKFFIGVPTISRIIRKSSAAVSFRCLAMLLESNVRTTTALDITSNVAPHIYYKEFFRGIKAHIEDGMTLPESFLDEVHWMGEDGRSVCGIMEIAAETGSANEMLNELADDYEEELDTIANQIDKLIEPFAIILLGMLVGLLIYAIYSPIFNLGDVILPKKG